MLLPLVIEKSIMRLAHIAFCVSHFGLVRQKNPVSDFPHYSALLVCSKEFRLGQVSEAEYRTGPLRKMKGLMQKPRPRGKREIPPCAISPCWSTGLWQTSLGLRVRDVCALQSDHLSVDHFAVIYMLRTSSCSYSLHTQHFW